MLASECFGVLTKMYGTKVLHKNTAIELELIMLHSLWKKLLFSQVDNEYYRLIDFEKVLIYIEVQYVLKVL